MELYIFTKSDEKMSRIHILLFIFAFFQMAACGQDRDLNSSETEKDGVNKNSFIFFDETNKDIKHAFKTYINPEGIRVSLVGVSHIAEKSFYEEVNNFISGKVLLYELFGHNLEEAKQRTERVRHLGNRYQKINTYLEKAHYRYFIRLFGLAYQQDIVDYTLAKKLIHADMTFEDIGIKNVKSIDGYKDKEVIKMLEDLGREKLENHPITKDKYFSDVLSGLKQINNYEESKIQNLSLLDDSNKKKPLSGIRVFDKQREQVAKTKLTQLLLSEQPPRNIAILYGADHMPSFEKYLLENKFSLEDEKFIFVLNLNKKRIKPL